MATTGKTTVKVTAYDNLVFEWTLKSQSVTNNTSSIYWEMRIEAGAYGEFITSNNEKAWEVIVNGTTYSGLNCTAVSNNSKTILAKGTTTVKHNANGSKTFSYSFKQKIGITYAGTYLDTFSGSGSGVLTTIPRASTVSAANTYIRDDVNIAITRASSTFKHTLQYKLTGQSSYTTLVSKTTATSYAFKTSSIAETALNLIPSNLKYIYCAINCITYDSSGTKLGEDATTIKLVGKDADLKPQLFPTIKDTNADTINLTGDKNIIMRYYSKPEVNFFPSADYNTEITSYKVVNGSKTLNSDTVVFTSGVESNVFTFTITDRRGYTVSKEVKLATSGSSMRFVNAVKPTITMTTTNPELVTTDKTTTFSFNLTLKGSCFCGNMGSKNAESRIYYRYKETGSNTWIGSTVTSGWIEVADSIKPEDDSKFKDNKTSYETTVTLSGLDYLKSYTVQGRIYNSIEPKETATQQKQASPLFEWDDEGFSFNIPITCKSNKYFTPFKEDKGSGGLFMNNGDINGCNGIWFADACDSNGEGLFFPNGSGYDVLYAQGGSLYFKPGFAGSDVSSYKVFYTPGDKIVMPNNTPIFGFLTSSRTAIILYIPLPKDMIGVTGGTVSGTLQMRGVGGYIYNQASNKETKTATFATAASSRTAEGITGHACKPSGNGLYMSFTFSSALTHNAAGTTATTNNSPVVVVPDGNFTITLT